MSAPGSQVAVRRSLSRHARTVALAAVVAPMRALPLRAGRCVGRFVGQLVFTLLKRYRTVAISNLEMIYGDEMTAAERKGIAKSVFLNFGQSAAEFVKLPSLADETVSSLVDATGEEFFAEAYARHHGVLLISAHYGNWEWMARWLAIRGHKLTIVARKANDAAADRLLMRTRNGNGTAVVLRGNSVRTILTALKKNEMVGLLPDQNSADVWVPFMGRLTGTADGPAVLHLRTGAPIVFAFCRRRTDGRFCIDVEPPLMVEPTGDKARDVERVTAAINQRIEARVRAHPDQWLWLHDRWKASRLEPWVSMPALKNADVPPAPIR
ncbi:MAG: lysophospholipid acyltransferase family protein [Armatimonadetes bacterium]|nr:lysophospholipid acyltransferase family protein [Armatimonadota bacterium]MDE2207733.1 lysophospholipid acyltransferase family protein [Armatimonadota bacterium]